MDVPKLRTDGTALLKWAGLLLLGSALLLVLVLNAPQVIGADHSYVVLSDSMSPTYGIGDVLIVRSVPTESLREGDVVTFYRADDRGSRTTHRIVGVERRGQERYFETKGDANEDPDPKPIPASRVVGRVWFGIPYVGYGLLFARSKAGIVLLVVVPALLLIVSEGWELLRAYRDVSESETTREGADPSADRSADDAEGD